MVAGLANQSGIDHDADTRNRERGLGDVRREDHLAGGRFVERAPLFVEREASVQDDYLALPRVATSAESLAARVDLGLPWQEDEHVARRPGGGLERLPYAERKVSQSGQRVARGRVRDVHREREPVRLEVNAAAGGRDALALERGRHDDEARRPHTPRRLRRARAPKKKREQQVHVEAPLVELVEKDRGRRGEQGGIAKHHARRREHDAGSLAGDALVAHDVSDGVAEPCPLEIGDAGREAPASDAARLDHEHFAARPHAPARYLHRLTRQSATNACVCGR